MLFTHLPYSTLKFSPDRNGDLKTQIEKLWTEVNALKEIQALQTGKVQTSSMPCPKGDRKISGFLGDIFLRETLTNQQCGQ